MAILSQRSFSSGEISPTLYSRVDTTKYATGLRTCRNFIVQRFGGAKTRPGTRHIGISKNSGSTIEDPTVRLIPFVFNDDQTYVLEMGEEYIRFIKGDAYVTESSSVNTVLAFVYSATYIQATTSTNHGWSNGDSVYISRDGYSQELAGKVWEITTASGANLRLNLPNGHALGGSDQYDYAPVSIIGQRPTIGKIYEISSPYQGSELFELNFVQSADIISIVHPNHAPRELTRTADDSWSLSETLFSPDVDFPENVKVTAGGAATNTYKYKVTAIDDETGEESIAGIANYQITGITKAVNAVITVDRTHSFIATDYIYVDNVEGMPEMNGTTHLVNSATATTITVNTNSTGYGTYTSGGKASYTIYAVTYELPAKITTVSNHGLSSGDVIYIRGCVGPVEFNDRQYVIDVVDATNFTLRDIDSTSYSGPLTSAGHFDVCNYTITNAAVPAVGAPHVINWDLVAGAIEYNVYKEIDGVYGQIGIAQGTSFDDIGIEANTNFLPPFSRNPFIGTGNFPSAVTFIQQRKAYANTDSDPEKIWLSRVGNFQNFTTSTPLQEDDSFSFTIAGREVNEVRNMLDLGRFVVLSSGGEWTLAGNDASTLTPTQINAKQYSYNGSSNLRPITINGSAIYNQARGSIIRDLAYNFESDGYSGDDLTLFSSHLFDGFTIIDWAYQQIPHSILWVVRSDGVLLGLTYVKEQSILAWHRHELHGNVESVTVVPDGNEDALYCVVKKDIIDYSDSNTYTFKMIEKITQMNPTNAQEAIGMDATHEYNGYGANATGALNMTLTGGSTWAAGEELTMTVTAFSLFYANWDIGRVYHLVDTDGDILKVKIVSVTSASVCQVVPETAVPTSLQGVATTTWARCIKSYGGLFNLENEEVAIYGDGSVVASPYNSNYTVRTVDNGGVDFAEYYAKVKIGLPFYKDIETLNVDTAQGEAIAGRKKLVSRVVMGVENTRGLWVGPKPPTDDSTDPTECLIEFKVTDDGTYDSPITGVTGNIDVVIRSEWSEGGRVFVRQVDPVPATIAAIFPVGRFPFQGG